MNKISNTLERAPKKPLTITDGHVYDSSVTIEPTNVELCSQIKESSKSKLLGAVLLFPKTSSRPAKRYWISLDHLYAQYEDKPELFAKFVDTKTKTFVGACKLGVTQGRVYLEAA